MQLSNAIDEFSKWKKLSITHGTIKGYHYNLLQFCLYMRNMDIEQIRVEDIIDYFNQLIALGWKQSSLSPKSFALRKLFQYWRKKGKAVIDYTLIPMIRREMNLPRVAEDQEIGKLLELCPKDTGRLYPIRNRAIINLLKDTGMRSGELCSLNVDDVRCDDPTMVDGKKIYKAVIKTEKSRGMVPYREVFWGEETNEDLKRWIKAREKYSRERVFVDPEALFIAVTGWQASKRFTSHAVAIMFRKLSLRTNVKT